jgi:hypothetical protein
MSDPKPDDPPDPAAPTGAREERSIEAARRLSQLLSRPLGTPAPPNEEPYVPRVERPAPPPVPAAEPADHTALRDTALPSSLPAAAPAPEPHPDPEPHLPWFDRPLPPRPRVDSRPREEPVHAPADPTPPPPDPVHEPVHASAEDVAWPPSAADAPPAEPSPPAPDEAIPHEPAPLLDDDLFDRHDPAEPRAPVERADEVRPLHAPEPPPDESAVWPHAYRTPREKAWPPPLDAMPEPPAPARPAPSEPPPPPAAGQPLDPDAARALAKIRRLMLVSNLFMLVAIAAVLGVVGYRTFRAAPAPPPAPPPPPVAAPAPPRPEIPVDMTLSLPRGARIKQTAVAGDRLVITLEIDGATEVRTFDLKTLQPAGRLSFGSAP